ncbi:LuxR C-terminal-related transcriptional regulator [Rhodococcus hoagii]|nr:LuxR C-terminal-related transcriptional regulator [Prescottella equi]
MSAAKVLVCAPAGAGKTTLLETWIANRAGAEPARNVAWLTLDPADNDAAQLQRRVRGALSRIESQDTAGVLVLDDAHVVTDNGALAQLTAVVASLPSRITFVVAARHAPGLPWSKYASDGSLSFLGCEELALERDSIASIFAAHHGGVSAGDLETVLEVTAGWAGAVCSAALLVGTGGDVRGDITALPMRPQQVSGYVVGETLAHLPEHLVRFVLTTSVVERFTDGLMEDLVGENADRYLHECERLGVPVRREVVDGELTYSWHPLVRIHMRAVLRESDSEHYARSLAVVARSLAESGNILAAFAHLAVVSDERVVEEVVHRYGPAAVFDGLGDQVVDALGVRNGRLSCVRLLRALVALESNDPHAARAHLRCVASPPEGRPNSPAVESFAAALGMEADLIGGTGIRAEAMDPVADCGTGGIDLDCYILVQCAAAHMLSGRFARSERVLKEALALADLGGHPRLVLRCLARLAILAAARGELATMRARAEHAVDYAAEHDLTERTDAAQSAAILCMCTYHRGEWLLDDSPLHSAMANRTNYVRPDGTTDPVTGNHAQVAFAIVRACCLPQATDEDMDAVCRAMLSVMARGPQKGFTSNYVVTSVAVLVQAGRSARAEDIVRGASELFGENPDVQVAQALIALEAGAVSTAERILRSVLESESSHSRILAVHARVLLAVTEARSRRYADAVTSIRRALELAESNLIVRPFMNFAGDVAELLPAIRPGEGVPHQFLDHVRAKLASVSAGRNPGLTPTERQVLVKLRTGTTLKEISKEMHLSVNTVRTHARNLYRKLGVSSREQAIEAAVRRGLL